MAADDAAASMAVSSRAGSNPDARFGDAIGAGWSVSCSGVACDGFRMDSSVCRAWARDD
jgi:hypothetical protein